jgi:amidohydrolase
VTTALGAVEETAESVLERVVGVRRAIHQCPELSNRETQTTARLRSELARAGLIDVHPLSDTGLVVDVPGASPGPIVAVRGDLDALPISEESEDPYASEVPGVMHACGHDVHAATVLGVALAAVRLRSLYHGTLRVIFQPAEESEPLGARQVISEGHLENVSAIIALHVSPDLDVGAVGIRSGPAMASSDEFTVDLRGMSSHAGWPHRGRDTIAAAAAVIQEAQKIVSRRIDPRSPVVLNFGKVVGGTSGNIVADHVTIEGTIRSARAPDRAAAQTLLSDIVRGISTAHDLQGVLNVTTGEPVLQNHPGLMDSFRDTGRALSFCDNVCDLPEPTMNSEDFAFYSELVPAGMVWLGGSTPGTGHWYPLHHPKFSVDERAMRLGVALLLGTALRLLGHHSA